MAILLYLAAVGATTAAGWLLGKHLKQIIKPDSPNQTTTQEQPPESGAKQPTGQDQPNQAETQVSKLGIFDRDAQPVSAAVNMTDAIREWQEKTNEEGSIINLETGEDLTPKEQTEPKNIVKKIWEWIKSFFGPGKMKRKSKVPRKIPVLLNHPVNPVVPPMNSEQIAQLKSDIKRPGLSPRTRSHAQNLNLLAEFIEQLNTMNLPVYKVAKKRMENTKHLVPIKKRRRKVRQKEITRIEERKKVITSSQKVPSIIAENEVDVRPIRNLSELKKAVPRLSIALPRPMLIKKLLERELPVRDFMREEITTRTKTEAVRKREIVDEPYVEEYWDVMEVKIEPSGQLLHILLDGSGSMMDSYPPNKAELGAAVAIAVIGRNLDNTSKYIYQIFATYPEDVYTGEDRSGKEKLIRTIRDDHSSSGGGTDILWAIKEAAGRIRKVAKPEDQPELLVITDGQDVFSAEQLYEVIGEDIILHTVMTEGSNESLQAHSSTYIELDLNSDHRIFVRR